MMLMLMRMKMLMVRGHKAVRVEGRMLVPPRMRVAVRVPAECDGHWRHLYGVVRMSGARERRAGRHHRRRRTRRLRSVGRDGRRVERDGIDGVRDAVLRAGSERVRDELRVVVLAVRDGHVR